VGNEIKHRKLYVSSETRRTVFEEDDSFHMGGKKRDIDHVEYCISAL